MRDLCGIKLVLFDIDGTLLRSSGAGRAAMEHALSEICGTRGSPAVRYDGKTDRQIVRELLRLEGHADAHIDERMPAVVRRYLETLRSTLAEATRETYLFPGVTALLDALEATEHVVLGLLTGNVAEGAALKLVAAGLDPARFRVSAFGSDHELRGELPAVALARAKALGLDVPGSNVVVIGDTPSDVTCGNSIGARAIGVATGMYAAPELMQHGAFAAFDDLADTDVVMEAILRA